MPFSISLNRDPSPKVIVAKGEPLKAFLPICVTVSGMTIDLRFVYEKELLPIYVTVSGMTNDEIVVNINAWSSIQSNNDPSSKVTDTNWLYAKAYSPI